jgi:hypothetical protein
MKVLHEDFLATVEGGSGPSCSQAAGWLFGAGVGFLLIPGLQAVGATLILSSGLGATCRD